MLTDLFDDEQLTSLNLTMPAESTISSSNDEMVRIASKRTFNLLPMMIPRTVQNGKRFNEESRHIFVIFVSIIFAVNVSGGNFHRCWCNYF